MIMIINTKTEILEFGYHTQLKLNDSNISVKTSSKYFGISGQSRIDFYHA